MQGTMTKQYRRMQDGVIATAHQIWLAGLGAGVVIEERRRSIADDIDEHNGRIVDDLVARGRTLEARGRQRVKKLTGRTTGAIDGWRRELDEHVEQAVRRLGVPHRHQIRALSQRVDHLTEVVESFQLAAGIVPARDPRSTYQLLPVEGGWELTEKGSIEPISVHDTKDAALAAGRAIGKRNEPSQLVVHRQDGAVQATYEYGD